MIEICGVSKSYGKVAALTDVSLEVERGEVVLLLGTNGAGKSTLARCVLGILPYSGSIAVDGLDPLADGTEVRRRVGYMAQSGGLHTDMRVAETLDFYAALRGVPSERGRELLSEVGLERTLDVRVGELSGGMLQRLAFALSQLSDPPILLLDEPTASLDSNSRALVCQRLRELAGQGKSILLSTHSEHDLGAVADRAITLEDGRVVADESLRKSVSATPTFSAPLRPQDAGAATLPPGPGGDASAPRPAGADLCPPQRPGRSLGAIPHIVRKELRDALHDRWLISYALLLGALGVVAGYMGLRSSAGLGLQMFGRTTATLTNLCLMLSPLIGLTMGAAAIAGERDRGTLETLLAQPLERRDLLLGKYIGLLLSLALATVAGFLPAGFVVAGNAGAASLPRYALFPGLAVLLIAAMLGVGLLISVFSRGGVQAQGRAIFLWFLFVLMYDLLLMGTLVASGLSSGALATLLLLNPVDSARVLVVLALEPDLYLLGPAGAFLIGELSRLGTAVLLMVMVLAWALVPMGLALVSFRLRPQKPARPVADPVAGGRPAERRALVERAIGKRGYSYRTPKTGAFDRPLPTVEEPEVP